jgi:hypothetical protein
MTRHMVAIVVFADVDGIDQGDANNTAVNLILNALAAGQPVDLPLVLPAATAARNVKTARVVEVRELATAMGNRYLRITPTTRAWNECDVDAPLTPEQVRIAALEDELESAHYGQIEAAEIESISGGADER